MHSSRRNSSSSAPNTTIAAHPYAKEEVDSVVEKDDNDKNSKVRRQTHERFCRRVCLFGTVIGLLGMVLLLVQQQQQQATAHLRLQHQADITSKTRAYDTLVDEVRAIKKTGVQMETDPHSLAVTKKLQDAARALCTLKYGDHARIAVTIAYPNAVAPSTPSDDPAAAAEPSPPTDTFLIEMAPLAFQPYSVYNFLEVARGLQAHNQWPQRPQSGFHRKASHVLQATMASDYGQQPLAFQEYSKEYPHKQRTVGYCGRPSGGRGCWYISTLDNTKNHGPGSQQQKNPYEAVRTS